MTECKTQITSGNGCSYIILAFFCFLWNPGPAWTGTQTHKLTVPQQVGWKEGKSDQEPEPPSWTNLGIWVCRYGLQGVESAGHGYYRKNQTTAFNVSVPTLQAHLSHHINLARLGGTVVEKLKRNRGHGYRHFLKGVLKPCVGGGHRGRFQRVTMNSHIHIWLRSCFIA